MASSQDIPLGPIDGSELICILIATGLWGITCVQTLFYFVHYPHDVFVFRAMVIWLWLVNCVHQLLLIMGVYGALITNFCNYDQASQVNSEYVWQGLLTIFAALPSQLFFIDRIAKFSGKQWLFFVLWAPAAMVQLVGAIVDIAFATITPTPQELASPIPASMFITVQAMMVAVDIPLTIGMTFLLWRSREQAQYRTRTVLQRLLILSLSTGAWTALLAIFTLIIMFALPNTFIYVGFSFLTCPLYCNTVLANLNARQVIKKLEHCPTDSPMVFLPNTEFDGSSSHGSDYERHEYPLAQTPRRRRLSETHKGSVEAGVQASLGTTKVEQFA